MAMDGKFGVYILPWPPINWRSRPTTTLERAFRVVGLGVVGRFSSSLEPENLPPTPIPPTRNARSRVVVGTAESNPRLILVQSEPSRTCSRAVSTKPRGLLDGIVVVRGLINKPRGPVTNHLARYSN